MTGTLLTSFLALMVTGIPVAIAMAGAALIYIWVSGSSPPMVVVHRMISGIDSFPLLAVPFFILAGNLMNNAGITNRIYNFALALVGWMKGGLGHVNIIGSVVFAGLSGTAIAVPDMPAKITEPMMLTCPKPPFSQPTRESAKL